MNQLEIRHRYQLDIGNEGCRWVQNNIVIFVYFQCIFKGNHMISSAINFSKTDKILRTCRASAIWGLWKIYRCLFIPNCTRKIMWLLINNIYEKLLRWLSRRNAHIWCNQTKNCASQGVRLIWKQKIRLAICEFLWLLTNQNAWFVSLFLHWMFLHCFKKKPLLLTN